MRETYSVGRSALCVERFVCYAIYDMRCEMDNLYLWDRVQLM